MHVDGVNYNEETLAQAIKEYPKFLAKLLIQNHKDFLDLQREFRYFLSKIERVAPPTHPLAGKRRTPPHHKPRKEQAELGLDVEDLVEGED